MTPASMYFLWKQGSLILLPTVHTSYKMMVVQLQFKFSDGGY